MFRSSLLILCVAACATGDDDVVTSDISSEISITSFHRERVAGDVFHYELRVQIGSTPNAALQIHRFVREIAPFIPRHTSHATMLLHGDFSTVVTNFAPGLGEPASPAPGLAPYLAAHDVDVWGVDRRWTLATDDTSDFGAMSASQELGDIGNALAIARTLHGGRLALVGFSHGGELAYMYASVEAARPAAQRHTNALVVLDWYGTLEPDQTTERQLFCDGSAFEYDLVAQGITDAPNDFFIQVGQLAASAPDAESPVFPPLTNRGAMLLLAGQTYQLAPFAPFYHLLAPVVNDAGEAVAFRETTEAAGETWFASAPPHQSMLEAADLDAQLCGDAPPVDAPLSRIRVPLLYLGAAGGVGAHGIYATTQVSSTDVTTRVVQLFPDDPAQDYGHGDLLFADSARTLAWDPLVAWLASH
jgi:hypothetical protein